MREFNDKKMIQHVERLLRDVIPLSMPQPQLATPAPTAEEIALNTLYIERMEQVWLQHSQDCLRDMNRRRQDSIDVSTYYYPVYITSLGQAKRGGTDTDAADQSQMRDPNDIVTIQQITSELQSLFETSADIQDDIHRALWNLRRKGFSATETRVSSC